MITTIDSQEAFEAITKETLKCGDVANITKRQLWVLEPSGAFQVKMSNYTLETGIALADMRGGGNIRDRGGFQIPLGFFSLHEDKSLVYAMARQVIEKSFLEYIGKAESKGAS